MSWHECEECGEACYCDQDDTLLPLDEDVICIHDCPVPDDEELDP